jgi:hypothetical protein
MTPREQLQDVSYQQTRPTCVLASYAIACWPFAKQPVAEMFTAYCDHFKLEATDPEETYCDDFHCVRTAIQAGYDVIYDLHWGSNQLVFKRNRDAVWLSRPFSLEKYWRSVERSLRSNRSGLLMAFVHKPGLVGLASNHSVVIGCDSHDEFYLYDTNYGRLVGVCDSINDLGEIGHGMLIHARTCRGVDPAAR